MGRAELPHELEARLERVDADDRLRARDPRPLDAELADAAGADDEHGLSGLHVPGEEHRAHAGEGRAAEQRRLLERDAAADGQRDPLGDDEPCR